MRSSEAENEVMAVIRRFGEKCQPDWFTEWWLDEQKQLVVVAVFEMEDWAVNFKKAMAGAKFCRPRGGKGLRETMLATTTPGRGRTRRTSRSAGSCATGSRRGSGSAFS